MKVVNKTVQPYTREKKQKPQWLNDPMEKKYKNINYCWSHGYDTNYPHMLDTFTSTDAGHKNEAT